MSAPGCRCVGACYKTAIGFTGRRRALIQDQRCDHEEEAPAVRLGTGTGQLVEIEIVEEVDTHGHDGHRVDGHGHASDA